MPLIIVAVGVALLLLLMIRFKLNGFIALILVALAVGIMQGMPVDKVITSIKNGVGGTLGSLALIMGFGAMLGKMLADCGGAQRIATTLIEKFGREHIQWAIVLTGFIVGFALFYEVGFVLMLPLVFTVAAAARLPLLYVGVPMAAALSVTHGFLPPHPGPTAIATIFHADMGKTLLYGSLLAVPTVILAGPVYARFLKGIDKPVPEGLFNPKTFTEQEMPSFGVSVATSLVPVILMAFRAVCEMILPKGERNRKPFAPRSNPPMLQILAMPLPATLRIAPVPALPPVLDFLQQARAQMFAGRVDTAALAPDLLNFEQVYCQQGRMLAAHDDVHGLVGTIAWRAYDDRFAQLDFTGRRVVEVVRLFVAPECRRQGIADALFAALKAQAVDQGMDVLYLHTHPFLPGAELFWQRHGFQVLCRDADPEWQTIHMECGL